jgi:hypothetical protein
MIGFMISLIKQTTAVVLWSLINIPLNLFIFMVFVRQSMMGGRADAANPVPEDSDARIRLFVENNLKYMAPRQGDEGLGTKYERMMVDGLLRRIAGHYQITSALESPADGITGIPGANSLALAGHLSRPMSLTNPSLLLLREADATWQGKGLGGSVRIFQSGVTALPFADRSHELSWSFCMLEKMADPVAYLKELSRVSSKIVLMVTINNNNLGNALHRWYHAVRKTPWDHGNIGMTETSRMVEAFSQAGLEVLETGAVDVPPSMDTQDMPLKGDIDRVVRLFGKKWEWGLHNKGENKSGLLDCFCWLENNLPLWFKRLNAHHIYVIGKVKDGR